MRINDANLLRQVVNYLDKHQEAVRVKKMLYCLGTGRWEKDVDYLKSVNTQFLIEQIVREQPTLDEFRSLLQNLVKTVNKPKQYIGIAKVVYLALGQLYPEFQQEHGSRAVVAQSNARSAPVEPVPAPSEPNNVPSAIQRAYTPAPTQAYNEVGVPSAIQRAYTPTPTQATTSKGEVPSAIQRAYTPTPTQATTRSEVASAIQRAYAPISTPELDRAIDNDIDESAYETYYNPDYAAEISPAAEGEALLDITQYDPFALRQSVMSYTNPLRAKIILLVMLYPSHNFGNQSIAAIREYFLDDLLMETVKAFPTLQDIEESMTYAVEQLVEVEEYGKAATGLLQSLATVYQQPTQGAR